MGAGYRVTEPDGPVRALRRELDHGRPCGRVRGLGWGELHDDSVPRLRAPHEREPVTRPEPASGNPADAEQEHDRAADSRLPRSPAPSLPTRLGRQQPAPIEARLLDHVSRERRAEDAEERSKLADLLALLARLPEDESADDGRLDEREPSEPEDRDEERASADPERDEDEPEID